MRRFANLSGLSPTPTFSTPLFSSRPHFVLYQAAYAAEVSLFMTHKDDSYNHVLKYTGLLGGVQVFYVLMSIIRNKFTALFIGTWGMGLADLYNRTAELIGNTTNFGIAFSAVRHLAELQERGEHKALTLYVKLIRTWTLLTALLGALTCLILSPWLSHLTLGDYHTAKGYALLSPMVAMTTLLGGEAAILKGMHRLRRMAAVSALGALLTMAVTIPLYWWLGVHGVIPVLLSTTTVVFLLNLHAATRDFPYRVGLFSKRLLSRGMHMLKLGSAYIAAGILGSGAEMGVRSFMVRTSSLAEAGLYTAGFTLIVSYARLVFVAMDADYFPRLSAAGDDVERRNFAINRQIDVLVLLMAPFLILFTLCLPLIIRLLYTPEFLHAVPMALCAAGCMFFKSVYAPISYLSLARGDSFVYLVMELLYDVVFVAAVIAGFYYGGLWGAGLGLSLANLFDLIAIFTVYSWRYGFKMERTTLRRCVLQFCLLLVGLFAAAQPVWGAKVALGGVVFTISAGLSWDLLRRETSIAARWAALRQRFLNKK